MKAVTKTQNSKSQTPHEAKQTSKAARPSKSKPSDKTKPGKAPQVPRRGKLGQLLGHSVVSVIRAMGKAGWDYEKARAALDKAGIEAAKHTVKVGLKRGRDGQKRIAPLSAKELETLCAVPAKVSTKKAA